MRFAVGQTIVGKNINKALENRAFGFKAGIQPLSD